MYIVLCFSMFFWKIIALPHQEHFAQSVSPNAMTGMADSGVVMIAICFILLPQWCFSQMCGMDLAGLKWGVVTPDALRAGLLQFFFRKAVAFVVCFMHAKVGSHLGIFECPVFFVVFFLLCLCMHDIHNMHDHALCFSVDTNVAKLVCITFMKHACMHASSTSCMWLGDIWLRLVLWYGSFWAGITFGYRMGQHGWSQGKSPAAFHRPGFQEQQDQTE